MFALIFTRKLTADDHRLEFRMVDVRRDDGAASGDFRPDELGWQPFADGDELHLGRDLAAAGIVQLCHRAPGERAQPARANLFDVRPRADPRRAKRGQPGLGAEPARPARVVDGHGARPVSELNFAYGHAHAVRTVSVDFLRAGKRAVEVRVGQRLVGTLGHVAFMTGAQEWRAAALPPPVSTGSGSKGAISITPKPDRNLSGEGGCPWRRLDYNTLNFELRSSNFEV